MGEKDSLPLPLLHLHSLGPGQLDEDRTGGWFGLGPCHPTDYIDSGHSEIGRRVPIVRFCSRLDTRHGLARNDLPGSRHLSNLCSHHGMSLGNTVDCLVRSESRTAESELDCRPDNGLEAHLGVDSCPANIVGGIDYARNRSEKAFEHTRGWLGFGNVLTSGGNIAAAHPNCLYCHCRGTGMEASPEMMSSELRGPTTGSNFWDRSGDGLGQTAPS